MWLCGWLTECNSIEFNPVQSQISEQSIKSINRNSCFCACASPRRRSQEDLLRREAGKACKARRYFVLSCKYTSVIYFHTSMRGFLFFLSNIYQSHATSREWIKGKCSKSRRRIARNSAVRPSNKKFFCVSNFDMLIRDTFQNRICHGLSHRKLIQFLFCFRVER